MRSATVVLLCLGAMVALASAQSAWVNPCDHPTRRYYTTPAAVQGVWQGSCVQMAAATNNSDPASAGTCLPTPIQYPYTIAYNGTSAGANIAGQLIPLGAVTVRDSMPIDRTYRNMLLDFTVGPGMVLPGNVYAQVTCYNGVPTYTEATIHRLANVNSPTAFPMPLKRDWNLWCNDSPNEVNEHAPMSFNIVCQATRVRDVGAAWP